MDEEDTSRVPAERSKPDAADGQQATPMRPHLPYLLRKADERKARAATKAAATKVNGK